MKKRYYNSTTKEWYTEGSTMTKRVDNGVFIKAQLDKPLKFKLRDKAIQNRHLGDSSVYRTNL